MVAQIKHFNCATRDPHSHGKCEGDRNRGHAKKRDATVGVRERDWVREIERKK